MSGRTDARALSAEEVAGALTQLGEDATVERIEQVRARVDATMLGTAGGDATAVDVVARARRSADEFATESKKMLQKIPENVRAAVQFALTRLSEIRDGVSYAADLERRVGQIGRYQADALLNRRGDIDRAQATVAEFRKHAPAHGVDADAVLALLGGEPDLTPSRDAQAWLDNPRGPVVGTTPISKGGASTSAQTKLVTEKSCISLVIDDPEKPRGEQDVVAAMTLYEGTGCWRLVDIRLSAHRKPSAYAGSLSADNLCASYKPESAAAARLVKSLLREYQEQEDGTLLWCTFDGIVRGDPKINGYAPVTYANFDQAGYFSKAGGLRKLAEIKAFWDVYVGDPAAARIPNDHLQPTDSVVSFAVFEASRDFSEEPTAEDAVAGSAATQDGALATVHGQREASAKRTTTQNAQESVPQLAPDTVMEPRQQATFMASDGVRDRLELSLPAELYSAAYAAQEQGARSAGPIQRQGVFEMSLEGKGESALELRDAARALLDAYGANVPDWLSAEYGRLESAVLAVDLGGPTVAENVTAPRRDVPSDASSLDM
jgi:hypothetical protein